MNSSPPLIVLRLRRVQLPALLLISLLQRAPLLRWLASADAIWVGPSLAQVLRSSAAVAVALGAVDTLAGATTFSATPVSPATATVGTPFAAAFAINGTPLPVRSYTITQLPPGLSVPGATARGDGVLVLNGSTGVIMGTPTLAGNFSVEVTAFEFAGAGGVSKGFSYLINVAGAPGPATAPGIVAAPGSQTVSAGTAVTFSVAASGTAPLAFQWRRDGVAITGATGSSFTLAAVTPGDAGNYTVVVSNAAGSATSSAAVLAVTVVPSIFSRLSSLSFDSAGRLYASDSAANILLRIGPDGAAALFAGSRGNAGSANGVGAQALFNQPGGLAVSSTGIIFVADLANATIRRIDLAGAVTTFAGSPSIRGNADGAGSGATFSAPAALAFDRADTLYVADSTSHTIRRISPAGAVDTLAGLAGVSGSVDATGTASRFNRPSGLAVDRAGNVYVADTGNNTVRKVTPSGAVTTLAGLAGVSGHDDGAGALFSGPTGLALDSDANLYVADTGNSTIRKISPTGVVTTVAGLTGIAGLKNGVGGEVFFNQPEALALDASGNLYVADIGNAAIRKITSTGTVTTLSLTASPTPTPAPIPASTPTPTPTPAPTPPPASTGGGGGGGGGAPSLWLLVALAVLGGVRQLRRHPTERSER